MKNSLSPSDSIPSLQRASCRLSFLLLFFLVGNTATAQYALDWRRPDLHPSEMLHQKVLQSEIDRDGNIIVFSYSDGNSYLYKLRPTGETEWVREVGYAGVEKMPLGVELDQDGNIYLAWSDSYIRRYDSEGNLIWAMLLSAENPSFHTAGGFVVSDRGDLFVTGSGTDMDGEHLQTVKMNMRGRVYWKAKYHFPNAVSTSIALDHAGNLFITGSFQRLGYTNIVLLKYREWNGELQFTKVVEEASRDYVRKTLIGTDNSVYLLAEDRIMDRRGLVLKFDAGGELLWRNVIGFTMVPNHPALYDGALDAQNNLVVLTREFIVRNLEEHSVTKYGAGGEMMWSHMFNAYSSNDLDGYDFPAERVAAFSPTKLSVNSRNEIAVTGAATTFIRDGRAIAGNVFLEPLYHKTILFDPDGRQIWQSAKDESDSGTSVGNAIAFDRQDNLYTWSDANHDMFFLQSYTASYPDTGVPKKLIARGYRAAACAIPVSVKNLALPPYPMKVGEQVRTMAFFRDYNELEGKGVHWTWGDGASPSFAYTTPGATTLTGQHSYGQPGIYTVGLDFSRNCLIPDSDDYMEQMVIYDPIAGQVNGSGELAHEASSLRYAGENGKAAFNFAVGYRNSSADKPEGRTMLLLNDEHKFESTDFDWLVVRNGRAAWQGTGTLDGMPGYRIFILVEDAGGEGEHDLGDKIRVHIWNRHGVLVYDNAGTLAQQKDLDGSVPGIAQGQIIIGPAQSTLPLTLTGPMKKAGEALEAVSVYPNPARGKATITFAAKNAGAYSVTLYDLKGALVKELKTGETRTDEAVAVEVDCSALPTGVYVIRLATADAVKAVKLVLKE